MALGRAYSIAITGLAASVVEIEADVGRGLPGMHLVGLPDATLNEARDRVRAATVNSGFAWPLGRTTVALSPADLPKIGSHYDLGLACAILNASGTISTNLKDVALLGELALDGRLRPVRGILSAVVAARSSSFTQVIVPAANLAEAALIPDITVHGAHSLTQVVGALENGEPLLAPKPIPSSQPPRYPDLGDVVGQEDARFAVEVAAAGAHPILLTGAPGVGKTMLAHRLPGLLPPLTTEEALEVTAIHSLLGELPKNTPLISHPPFVAPHHTATAVSLIGGGAGFAMPGAVSRAHRGVLFLDECGELKPQVLDMLRTPLEEGEVRISRKRGVARYPARFLLALATNPCGCAATNEAACICTSTMRRRYQSRLSGPLLDRIDLAVRMWPTSAPVHRNSPRSTESTQVVRSRVIQARRRAQQRWQKCGFTTNSEVPGPQLRSFHALGHSDWRPINDAVRKGLLSARGADRAMRVAWTIADLADEDVPTCEHIERALSFRVPTALTRLLS
ncbi:YifB family Mg chelatase-like AAA ATPase [Hoyosella rhizosphaerae]|uniref:AAA+ ATPase domain-containing protein n=1 Tax=Hoyosella rhizosphaerae TaxID=1755582 RepID=A0A916XBC1_9ACTN|nr:YifB family Mg chelatase-like AAA ATPase [Hoyosella rhizosphaerae]MBN4926249.1 YifB family Mg chelatase-like AAA ATPase [Hoyosella rhizosphaerae]GGC60898.1 hypothetical protein GCM10011410_11720 [Hoyosella rhizosphaerae]